MRPAPQPPPPAPLLLRARVLHPLVLAALSALTVLHTWPLAARLRGHVAGGTEDVFMNMWHLWWMRQVLWEAPASPYFAPGLHWPLGAEMYWHTLAPAKTRRKCWLNTVGATRRRLSSLRRWNATSGRAPTPGHAGSARSCGTLVSLPARGERGRGLRTAGRASARRSGPCRCWWPKG